MSMFLPSYREAAAYRPEQFNPVSLAGGERVRVLLVCFEPGQFIPVHQPGVDLVLLVLEGEGRLIAGDRDEPISPGAIAFIPAGEPRGVRADSRMVALQVVTPPPTEADHTEVVHRLGEGRWR
jgi:quercetin dioxygenase-like cupin family protein